jgi:hypothetical protein
MFRVSSRRGCGTEALTLYQPANRYPLGLAATGFMSALLLVPLRGHDVLGLSPPIFGTLVGIYLGMFGDLRSFGKFAAFIFACIITFPLSILIVLYSRVGGDSLDVTLPQFFVGGGVGAFFVLLAGMLLFGPKGMRSDTLGLAFVGALGGAVLGLLGGALDRKIGKPTPGNFGVSVYFVWQSGVALILGVLLRWGRKQYLSVS